MRRYWQDPAIYEIDPNRTDLAEEFRNNIRGPHSEELRYVLHRMRALPIKGKYVLLTKTNYREWVIGQLTGRRGEPARVVDERVFNDLDEAEWKVFKLRWRDLTGQELQM